ncbi:MAG: DUF1841 family protein [Solirubrobacteraceae bacterium]
MADPQTLAAVGLSVEQLADPDLRAIAIRGEHPQFEQALAEGHEEIEGNDGPMNPRLHLAVHEVVATQLWDNSPPEAWDTAVRLLDAGYDRHEILHMLAGPMIEQIQALRGQDTLDPQRHIAALRALPQSWERQRTIKTATKRHDEGRKQARRAARAARQRNRRPR